MPAQCCLAPIRAFPAAQESLHHVPVWPQSCNRRKGLWMRKYQSFRHALTSCKAEKENVQVGPKILCMPSPHTLRQALRESHAFRQLCAVQQEHYRSRTHSKPDNVDESSLKLLPVTASSMKKFDAPDSSCADLSILCCKFAACQHKLCP